MKVQVTDMGIRTSEVIAPSLQPAMCTTPAQQHSLSISNNWGQECVQLEGRHSDDVSQKGGFTPTFVGARYMQYAKFQGLDSSLWLSAAVRPYFATRKITIHYITQVFLSLIWDLRCIQSSDNICKPRSGSRANLLCDPEADLTFYVSTSYAREYNR